MQVYPHFYKKCMQIIRITFHFTKVGVKELEDLMESVIWNC